jgi:metal-responsive CopG/Arc/MetJ family transcriptional regulator
MPETTRTTVTLPPQLMIQLKVFSKTEGTTISHLIARAVQQFIQQHQDTRLAHMHRTLRTLSGAGGAGKSDISSTIDETLYGEQGTWKGQRE